MKGKKLIALAVGAVMCGSLVAGLTGCNNSDNDILIWVSETEGVKTLTETQIDKFLAANEEYQGKYKITVQGQTESESATQMVTDVATGADIFCFASDQLGRLIEANALSKLGDTAAKYVADNNDEQAVGVCKDGNSTYCFPITSDNSYFMFYDKSVITDESHLTDLATLVADCKEAGKKFCFELEGSAWYNASFFFGAGCHSTWNFNTTTRKWQFNDDFNSDKGIIALKGMGILTKEDSVYVSASTTSDLGSSAAIVVSGTWGISQAKSNLGNNYGVAKLPSYTVDGKSYKITPYTGNKLMGVKPHGDVEKQKFCNALAQYLSGKDCQEERFDQFGWGPSNKDLQALDKVKNEEALSVIREQNEYAVPQGRIYGGWWDVAKLLGQYSKDADLQAGLDKYTASCEAFTKMSEEAMNAFGVIGAIASLAGKTNNLAEGQTAWVDWNADFAMEKSAKDGNTIYKTVEKITLAEGDAFKIRQGQAWDVQYGDNGNDVKVTAANGNVGTFYIVLTIDASGKGTISYEA